MNECILTSMFINMKEEIHKRLNHQSNRTKETKRLKDKKEKRKYFNVRKFRVQKISRISRMTPEFAKLNGRKKILLADSRKLIPTRHSLQIFWVIFCLLEHKNRFFGLFYQCFCLGKFNFAKFNSREMNEFC